MPPPFLFVEFIQVLWYNGSINTMNHKGTYIMEREQAELLNITMEEAAEVVQAISKVFRFGWTGSHPNTPEVTNKAHLEEEIGDFLCMIKLLEDRGLLDPDVIGAAFYNKQNKLAKWSSVNI